ncbi:MAG: DNA polymerase I [Proteobacteria bacterium]|jgi:DNA polymerase-1|nr:DNA polymerase I [Pseudomonadota bacterium]
MKKIYLIDVSSLFFRAFYAIRPLTSSKGVPVNAIYGLLSMLLKIMKDEKPDYMAICYDRKEPSFRKEIFDDYKANRTEMPEDLVPQVPYMKKLAEVLGIPGFEVEGFEADDLIGSLAQIAHDQEFQVYIVSGDKDFGQLIKPGIFLMDTMKEVVMGPNDVKEKWGVPPQQFIDYLALVGDSSDNVPGVKGIGPKGAVKLLEQYGTLENIYEHISEIKGATQQKLIDSKEMAFLSRKLVTIVKNVALSKQMEDYKWKGFQKAQLFDLLAELNFKNFDKSIAAIELGITLPLSPKSRARVNLDTETPVNSRLDLPAASETQTEEITSEELSQKLPANPSCWVHHSSSGRLWIAWDQHLYRLSGDPLEFGKIFDVQKIKWNGYQLKSLWHLFQVKSPLIEWDGELASYVVKAGESTEFSRVLVHFTGYLLSELPTPEEELKALKELKKALHTKLEETHQAEILEKIDLPLAPILFEMEEVGVGLDQELLKAQSQELAKDIQKLESQIHELSEEVFNIGSPKQLAQVLFEKLKLTPGKKTKTGFSTDNEVLEKLKAEHPIAKLLIEYRELTKLKSTYVDALPLLVKADGRIHTHFNQALTATGRLSSTEPNLQNIPIRTERGAKIRKAFRADGSNVLLSVDYSQIELRILAHFSSDKNLIKAFEDNLDIHAATAAEVFGVALTEVTADQRRTAKAINFGIAYGQGPFGLAENLGISRTEAGEIIKRYFTNFPGVKDYIESTIQAARATGFVKTLIGRRRYMDELQSKNVAIQKFGERAAINAPIQGTASDIVRKAMIEVKPVIQSRMILQVHDELIFEGPEELLRAEMGRIVQLMENVTLLKVPLKANAAIGKNWDEAH